MADTTQTTKAEGAAGYRKSTGREYFESIVIAVILALFIRTWVVQAFKIPTGSMEQNLLVGDHLLVNKFVFAPTATELERVLLPIEPIRRRDVIVFKYPEEPERDFIKRVIGLPGETVELRDRIVYINGKPLEEKPGRDVFFLDAPAFGPNEISGLDRRENYGPVTVPPGHYFVMGDNRDNSQDSRWWGFLPAHYVKGKALMIYWSYDAGAEEVAAAGLGGRLRQIGSVVVHFFTRTRWSRILHQIS